MWEQITCTKRTHLRYDFYIIEEFVPKEQYSQFSEIGFFRPTQITELKKTSLVRSGSFMWGRKDVPNMQYLYAWPLDEKYPTEHATMLMWEWHYAGFAQFIKDQNPHSIADDIVKQIQQP